MRLLIVIAILSLLEPSTAFARPRHGVIWYVTALNASDRQLAARRYEVGVTGREGANDFEKAEIRAQNPSFRWFVYNSGTDNYVPPNTGGLDEYNLLNSICVARGWDPEIAYLHYRDDTRIVLEGDTLLIRGRAHSGLLQGSHPPTRQLLHARKCRAPSPGHDWPRLRHTL
jgi:hypothetical protein